MGANTPTPLEQEPVMRHRLPLCLLAVALPNGTERLARTVFRKFDDDSP